MSLIGLKLFQLWITGLGRIIALYADNSKHEMLDHFNFPSSHTDIISYFRITNIAYLENILKQGEGSDEVGEGEEKEGDLPAHFYKSDGTWDTERFSKHKERQKAKREMIAGIGDHVRGGMDR